MTAASSSERLGMHFNIPRRLNLLEQISQWRWRQHFSQKLRKKKDITLQVAKPQKTVISI